MSTLFVVLGLALAAFGATASVAVRAVSRLELARWVSRKLEGAEAAVTLLSRPGDVAAAADALVAIGVAVAGVSAPWALRTAGLATTLALEVLLGVPVLLLAAYFLPRAVGQRWPEPLGGRSVRGRAATECAELAALLRDSATAGLAGEDELEIVTGVMAFADRVVREVMTPRTRIVAAPEQADAAALAALVTSSGYTRIPLYRSSPDEIVGMVHAFDVIKAGPGGKVGMRPVSAIPGARRCADALLDLRRERRHMAVVLDEFGGTAGLVTMEDLLEELVGEIFDELDEPRPAPVAPERGVLVVDAAFPLEALSKHFGVELEVPPRVETAGGYLAWATGRIPKAGERAVLGALEFDVLEATATRLVRLVVRAVAPEGATRAAGSPP